jgi:hypothetical protein
MINSLEFTSVRLQVHRRVIIMRRGQFDSQLGLTSKGNRGMPIPFKHQYSGQYWEYRGNTVVVGSYEFERSPGVRLGRWSSLFGSTVFSKSLQDIIE